MLLYTTICAPVTAALNSLSTCSSLCNLVVCVCVCISHLAAGLSAFRPSTQTVPIHFSHYPILFTYCVVKSNNNNNNNNDAL